MIASGYFSVTNTAPAIGLTNVIGPLYGPVAGGTRLTLVGQSLSLVPAGTSGVTTNPDQNGVISGVTIGNYTAVVDRTNRFDFYAAAFKQYHDITESDDIVFCTVL